jgi:putative endonuclease
MWVVYILLCNDGSYYCGITNNLEARLAAHNNKTGAKYTRTRTPCKVAWKMTGLGDRSLASKIEYRIKRLTRADKIKMISHDYSTGEFNTILDNILMSIKF